MKSVVATLGMLAALANAHQEPRNFNFRRQNGTESAADSEQSTTLTVLTTSLHTVISCAPTVTDCPADESNIATLPESEKTSFVVTNTIALTTTICPVTQAESISKSIISEAETGTITGSTLTAPQTASVPLSTGVPVPLSTGVPETTGPAGEGEGSSSSTITTDIAIDRTVTLTLGTGSSASVVTSTIQTTIHTTTVIPFTPEDKGDDTEEGNKGTGEEEETTTISATSTGYVTLTVTEPSVTETSVPGDSDSKDTPNNGNGGSGEGACECPDAPATVTVTEPASTVFVTIGAGETGSDGSPTSPSGATPTDDKNTKGGEGSDDGDDACEDEEDDDAEDGDDFCEEDATTTVEATVTVIPYPTGNNGTQATQTQGTNGIVGSTGFARPTGFARLVR